MVGCSLSSKWVLGQETHSGDECHTLAPIFRLYTIGPQIAFVWNTEVTDGAIPLASPRYTKNAARVSAPISATAPPCLRHPNVEAVGWLRPASAPGHLALLRCRALLKSNYNASQTATCMCSKFVGSEMATPCQNRTNGSKRSAAPGEKK